VLDGRRPTECGLHISGGAFVEQHRDDLLRRAVAEELAERLLVPGDAVPIDQSDEIRGSEAA
jgi:hypothetical protein